MNAPSARVTEGVPINNTLSHGDRPVIVAAHGVVVPKPEVVEGAFRRDRAKHIARLDHTAYVKASKETAR